MRRLMRVVVFSSFTGWFLIASLSVHSFELSGSSWAADEATFFTSALNTTGSGLTSTELRDAFIDAMNEWSSATNFNYQTSTGSADPCFTSSSFDPNDNDNGYTFAADVCGDAFGSTTLAVARTTFSSSGILQSGIVFNSTKSWGIYNGTQGSSSDFRRVAVHELGHSLGLNHSTVSPAIMLPSIGSTEVPQVDDLNGVESLYGVFDSDGDNIGDSVDNCPDSPNPGQEDFNSDGEGDACDNSDGDSIFDDVDNCPAISNADQLDLDNDDIGNVCDSDADGDGVLSGTDSDDLNAFLCSDGDGDTCDDCSSGVFDQSDDGLDTDNDGICNAFEIDDGDGDGVDDGSDNCPVLYNPDQEDSDNNGVGDACEDFCFPIVSSNNKLAVICL